MIIIVGLVLAFLGFVLVVGASRTTGTDPRQDEFEMTVEGGVSRSTSGPKMAGWVLLIGGIVLAIVGIL